MSARAARQFVVETLRDAGFTGDVDTVVLMASELVTNAIRHAQTPFELLVDATDHSVKVTVVDHDPEHSPEVRDPGPDDTNGRGLLIVRDLASHWGSEPRGEADKAVWFSYP